MHKVSLNLSKLSRYQKIQLCRTIVNKMTGNASFPNPFPPLSNLTTLADELETNEQALLDAQKAVDDARVVLRKKEKEIDIALRSEANHIDNVAAGDEAIISRAGVDSVDSTERTNSITPNRPEGLKAVEGRKDGSIDLQWSKTDNATMFIVQISDNITDPNSWVQVDLCTKRRFVVTNLKSGQRYWFRVAGTNSAGTGGFSDPATKIAQ